MLRGIDRAGLRDSARQARAAAQLLRGGHLRDEYRVRRGTNIPSPIPPPSLTYVTAGSFSSVAYHEGGRAAHQFIRGVLLAAGLQISPTTKVLDFGCGAGSVLRWWGSELFAQGCDLNADLVGWCAAHLQGVPTARNELEPPTTYPNGEFDAIYALSVMTHLRPDLQLAWMKEWARIVRPGGLILASFHGKTHVARDMSADDLEREGHLTRWSARSGSNLCASWNSQADVIERIGQDLTLVWSRTDNASSDDQDIYIFKVPA